MSASMHDGADDVAAATFGFAMVENFKAFWAAMSPSSPQAARANRLHVATKLYGPDDRVAVSPNNDTLYSGTMIDVRAEPVVLRLPEVAKDRYYSVQLIDALTDNPAMLGSRTTGNGAGDHLLVPPGWAGEVPPGMSVVQLTSSLGMATLRSEVRGADDIEASAAVARAVEMVPLSVVLGQPAPPPAPDPEMPPFYDAKTGDAVGFLRTLAWMMRWQSFGDEHAALLAVLADRFGIEAGRPLQPERLDAAALQAFERGLGEARERIRAEADRLGERVGTWRWSPLGIGHFGADHLGRAAVAWKYIYAADAAEAVYPMAVTDLAGETLDGSRHRYRLRFEPGGLPPARFFWSVTMYGADGFMVDNPIGRYSIGDRTPTLVPGADGSVTVHISAEEPAGGTAGWLPAPAAPFYVLMRIYGPSADVLGGRYRLPDITAAGAGE